MKKFSLVFVLVFLCFNVGLAQDQTEPNGSSNEVKLNVFNLIVLNYIDGSYEYLIDEESSVGVGLLVGLNDDTDLFDVLRDFSLTPYYRRYFSKGYAKGFFVEGFGMLSTNTFEESFTGNGTGTTSNQTTFTDFALGVSIGGKFVSKKGFVAEVYGGIGRNLFNTDNGFEAVGRGGVSLGFRF